MHQGFTDIAGRGFKTEAGRGVIVRPNHFAVLTTQSAEDFLMTTHTNVCAGLALVSQDKTSCALVHVYSDGSYFAEGREAVERHGVLAWEKLNAALPGNMRFRAVAFGSRDTLPQGFELAHERLSVSAWLGDAFYEAAMNSGRIATCRNMRYHDVPHDALVDFRKGEIKIARTEKDTLFERPYEQGYREATPLFPDFGIHGN